MRSGKKAVNRFWMRARTFLAAGLGLTLGGCTTTSKNKMIGEVGLRNPGSVAN